MGPAHTISCQGMLREQYRVCVATVSVRCCAHYTESYCIVIRRRRKILSIEHVEDARRAIHSICLEPDTCRSPTRNMSRCAMAEAGASVDHERCRSAGVSPGSAGEAGVSEGTCPHSGRRCHLGHWLRAWCTIPPAVDHTGIEGDPPALLPVAAIRSGLRSAPRTRGCESVPFLFLT